MTGRMLSPAEARRFYDRIGPRQDSQAFYEDRAVDAMIAAAALGGAEAVVEFGCGTGRLAERLLRAELPPDAAYRGFDASPVMVSLASERVAPFGKRALATLLDGAPAIPLADGSADRVISTYVLDLLPAPAIETLLRESARVLRPGGLLCVVSLTNGIGVLSRTTMAVWRAVHRLSPALVGGCRPIRVAPFATDTTWETLLDRTVVSWGIPSEVLVARRTSPDLSSVSSPGVR